MQLKSLFVASATVALALVGWQISTNVSTGADAEAAVYAPRVQADQANRLRVHGRSKKCFAVTLRQAK